MTTVRASHSTRRQAIVRLAAVLGGMAAGSKAIGQTPPPMKEPPATPSNQSRTFLHQEVLFDAGPPRIYEALLDSKQFAAFTGMPAQIDPKAGGSFSMFGGLIVGVNVELASYERIVQAWRPTHWDAGVYSIVKFELKSKGAGTNMILDHTGFPEGEFDHLNPGWPARYWEPLKIYLAKG